MFSALLNWGVLTVSFFNTISLLWLGCMVLLAGNRRSAGTWLTGGGLLLGALFFTSHTAILGRGLSSTSLGMDFWWWVSWLPAVVAPLAWYGSLLWYSGYRLDQPHPHHTWLALVVTLAGSIALLLIFANPLPTYQYVAGRVLALTPSIAGIPLVIAAYVSYSLLCYLLPVSLMRKVPPVRPLEARARLLARPYLMSASAALLLAGIMLAWTAWWALTTQPAPTLSDRHTEQVVLSFDLAVASLVALAVTLLGRAVVGFEVFTGRALPRNRFLRQWRSTVILAGGFGAAAAWTLSIELRPIYSLMLATGLMTLFYALYSWRSFAERESFMERLRPFIASQNLYGQLTTPQLEARNDSRALFDTLCRDVLELRRAALAPTGALATLAGPPIVYPAGSSFPSLQTAGWPALFTPQAPCLPAEQAGATGDFDWAVPLWSSRGLDGVLFLGEKNNANPFSEEEIEIAQTAGERMLDLIAGTEMARLSMDLLRQRLAQARVLDGQGRRILHDEVLPELHTALLQLSSRPADPDIHQAMASLSTAHRQIADLMREMPLPVPHRLMQNGLGAALRGLVEHDFANDFAGVTWQIAPEAEAQVRALPLFVNEVLYFATRELIRNAAVHGSSSSSSTGGGGTASGSGSSAERGGGNASSSGSSAERGGGTASDSGSSAERRGGTINHAAAPAESGHGALHLKISLEPGDGLCLTVEDDGAGFRLDLPEDETEGNLAAGGAANSVGPGEALEKAKGGAQSGLRIHSAMLAAVGARLEVLPLPGKGTRARITMSNPAKIH